MSRKTLDCAGAGVGWATVEGVGICEYLFRDRIDRIDRIDGENINIEWREREREKCVSGRAVQS